MHEVDRPTYPTFARSMGWIDPPMFPECRPVLGEKGPQPDARERINERLQVKGLRLEPPSKKRAQIKESRKRSHEDERRDEVQAKKYSQDREESKEGESI